MAALRKKAVKENSLKGELIFTNYYRIAAYHQKGDFSIIVDQMADMKNSGSSAQS